MRSAVVALCVEARGTSVESFPQWFLRPGTVCARGRYMTRHSPPCYAGVTRYGLRTAIEAR